MSLRLSESTWVSSRVRTGTKTQFDTRFLCRVDLPFYTDLIVTDMGVCVWDGRGGLKPD